MQTMVPPHIKKIKNGFALQAKYSIRAIFGMQQPANEIQSVSGCKIFPMKPNAGKVFH
jgi:hypothetical protein